MAYTNNDLNRNERMSCIFFHMILNSAHKLDLLRCYTPQQFSKATKLCLDLSVKSLAQQTEYNQLLRYCMKLIKAHGDKLCTAIDSHDSLIAITHSSSYQEPFHEASLSLKRLFEIGETVSKPEFLEIREETNSGFNLF